MTDENTLISDLTGRLYLEGSPGFEEACFSRVFNKRRPTDRRPAAVLQAANVDDVVKGVQLARERGWQVTVRAGGHSWIVWSVHNDALLIDLGAFTNMQYDADTDIVRAGPAVRGGADLDPYLASRGRFFNGGHCPTVGIGGFLLQGGMGWNCRGWGWAAESVVAVDVVTADGERLTCDANQNSDLFWAARGAGPGFPAIITAFHLQTRPRFTALTNSKYVYPAEVAPQVLEWLHEARWELDDSIELVAVNLDATTIPQIPYDGPVLVVDGVSFAPTTEEGAAALAPLDTCPVVDRAIVSRVGAPVEMAELRADQERANPEGHYYVSEGAYVAGSREDVVRGLTPAFTSLPTLKSFTIWFDMGNAPSRGLPDMALSLQSDIYFAAYLVAETEEEIKAASDWIRDRARDMEPVKVGTYLGDSDLLSRPAKFMSDEAYARLTEIRQRRDPGGLFCDYLFAEGVPVNTNPWQA